MCEARVMRLIFIIDEEMSKWIMEIKIIIIIIKWGEEKEERRRVNALLQGRLPGDIEMNVCVCSPASGSM